MSITYLTALRYLKAFSMFSVSLLFAHFGNSQSPHNSTLGVPIHTPVHTALKSSMYRFGAGLRIGSTSGISFKYFIAKQVAVEALVGVMPNGFGATFLYEQYNSLTPKIKGLNIYYGAGLHASFYSEKLYYATRTPQNFFEDNSNTYGIDSVFGLEYKIASAPIAISTDLKPSFELSSHGNAYTRLDPGIGLKYTF